MKRIAHHLKSLFKHSKLNHNGVTLLETVAAVAIISLVLVSAFTIAINTRTQVLAQERRISTQQEISRFRNKIMATMNASQVAGVLNFSPDYQVTLTKNQCSFNLSSSTNICTLFNEISESHEDVTVYLTLNTDEDITTIEILVVATFFGNRTTQAEGIVFPASYDFIDIESIPVWDPNDNTLTIDDYVQGLIVLWPDSSGNNALWVQHTDNSDWAYWVSPGNHNADDWGPWNKVSNPNLIPEGSFNVPGDEWYHKNVYFVNDIVFHQNWYWIVHNKGEATVNEPGNAINNLDHRDGWNRISSMDSLEPGRRIIDGDEWFIGNIYEVGDVVSHNGYYWIAHNGGSATSNEPEDLGTEGWSLGWNQIAVVSDSVLISELIASLTSTYNNPGHDWVSSNVYRTNDIVSFNGNLYIATQDSSNVVPTTTWAWQIFND